MEAPDGETRMMAQLTAGGGESRWHATALISRKPNRPKELVEHPTAALGLNAGYMCVYGAPPTLKHFSA